MAPCLGTDRPGILRIIVPNRKHPRIGKNAQIADGVRQTGENSTAQSHRHPKRRCLESTAPSGATNDTRQTDSAVQSSPNHLHPFSTQARLASDTSTEAANEARQNLTPASTSSAHPSPNTDTPKMGIKANKQSETTLWISIPSSADAVPVKLRSCMTLAALFDCVFKICGMTEQQQQDRVVGLRTSLVWTEHTGVKKNVMLKREFEDCFETFLKFIDTSPCWEEEGYCSVDIEPVMAEGT